ncbi:inositol polyphosphate 5-phosphatase INPP5B/F, partial [Lecanoromycetidae sp. Uapishka_2]
LVQMLSERSLTALKMASNSSLQRPPNTRMDTTPGAFPASPSQSLSESPVIVSSQLSLSQAVHERRAEFTRSRRIKVKVGTWNVASLSGTEKDVGGWFVDGKGVSESLSGLSIGEGDTDQVGGNDVQSADIESLGAQEQRRSKKKTTLPNNDPGSIPGGEEIGIYALGLQEIVDVGSATEALRPYSDPHPAKKWKAAVAAALPPGYTRIAEQQLIGLFIVIYASAAIAPTISSVSTTSVGTGLMGYMGNKGAVTARIVLGETTRMVFVNCHLTAGVEKGSLERRNWDVSQVLSRTKFDPIYDGGGVMEEFGEGIDDEDFAFWFGDLNYRLEDIPGEDVRRLLMLHTRNEYGRGPGSRSKVEHELASPESSTFHQNQEAAAQVPQDDSSSTITAVSDGSHPSIASSATLPEADQPDPHADPTSLQTTLSSLLTHDQLHAQMQKRQAFHDGWREGPIDFLPTYKYDVGSVGMFDSSEKRRGPSWCDRILYRTRKDRTDYEEKVQQEELARKKDNEMKFQGVVEAAQEEDVLFDYDPDNDGADDQYDGPAENPQVVATKAGFEDRIQLDYYASHQRVLSSDHKPLDAVFTLDYDAVDPDLKARVHQEVARELDKAENEGRPVVTVVVDQNRDNENTNIDQPAHNFEGVNFGDVKYDHVKTRTVTIANTGRVPATVGFVDRSNDNGQPGGVCPPWLDIRFDRPSDHQNSNPGALQEFTLRPGDAANVELTLHVTDMDFVRRLSDGLEKLEDVLVLRIHNGRDYFLPLRGNWLQSAFGRSIDKLVRIPEGGVRRLQHQRPGGSSHGHNHGHGSHHRSHHGSSLGSGDKDDGVKWSAPRELFRLTEAIEELIERSLAEWDMRGEDGESPWDQDVKWPFGGWVTNAKERNILELGVREALDTSTPFIELFPPETGLEDGIITSALWTMIEQSLLAREKPKISFSSEDERALILDALSTSPAHSVSFTFVTFMLSRVANEIVPLPKKLARRGTATSFEDMEVVQSASDDPARVRRREVDAAYAEVFAEAMVRLPPTLVGKARKASELKRKRVVEVFLGEYGVNGL